MSIETISPCPFCGVKPKEVLLECGFIPPSKGAEKHHDVICQTEGCEVQNRAVYNKAWNMVAGDKDTLHEALKNNWV
ncbi:hypothetical protein [Kosakonia cowanii]|uniref:hypothetical protein n=1 Tax=Kosakonia cowanii TaxID=208223 RepID=UPI0028AC8182|nr:hypothetical protein [Kosakonia cowanii]